MSSRLLATKLYVPPIRPEMVSRPRLIERLKAGLHCKLTLVSAPAGFGKTTLLSECAIRCGWPAAWLSLDKGDNDPGRFWAYFVAALQTIPELHATGAGETALAQLRPAGLATGGSGASAAAPVSLETALTSLVNDIAATGPSPFILILDDLHLVAERQIHDGLVFLLEHLPPQLHLAISSRADPPWPLARLRARGDVAELRAQDLRFTSEEAAAFLNKVMHLDLSPEDIAALDARTEGWIAGLQMVAISMQGRKRTHGAAGLSSFIKAITGSHRFILDYLVEEVLEQQPPDLQAFLLKTSVLDRLTAPLCDAVAGIDDSQAVLVRLEQANLFLMPLDDDRRWYRYHHLFADLLHARLEQHSTPQEIASLHRRAGDWYEDNDLIAEAVSHALSAGDVDQVARLVERNALAALYQGQVTTVVGWLDALPGEVVCSRPWLCIAHAWVLASTGRWHAVTAALQDAERAGRQASQPEAERIAAHILALRTYATAIEGDLDRTKKLARQALDRLPREDLPVRSLVTLLLGSALRYSGELSAAAGVWTNAFEASRAAGDSCGALSLLSALAATQIEQGRLRKAAANSREALRLADEHAGRGGQPFQFLGPVHARLSALYREWNDPQAAVYHARQGLALSESWGHLEAVVTGHETLAYALQAAGDADAALEAMHKARQASAGLSAWYEARTAADQARLWLILGDVAAAARWSDDATGLEAETAPSFDRLPDYLTKAWTLIAQNRPGRALDLLARLSAMIDAAGAAGFLIESLVLRTMALQARGELEWTVFPLEHALFLAEPEGYVRTFIDHGQLMVEPLTAILAEQQQGRPAAAWRISPAYILTLLSALGEKLEETPLTTAAAAQPSRRGQDSKSKIPLIEPLSERELEVLHLLSTSLSTPEIADELFISVSTVRTHIKNIYGKLNAHNRIGAVERSRELGLL
ncbi:MAG: AAA family ATPase [Anaerolineae bacterium]|nr:AAA family ATPase [Anaerolineae bacterium]